jgi:hypothetical protein
MAAADDRTEHVRAYLEYFRDMGVHEFYRNETLGPVELSAAADNEIAVAEAIAAADESVPQRLKPDSRVEIYGAAEAVPLSKTSVHHRLNSRSGDPY